MKVLLIQDVDNLGYAGDVKKVANGFGRNYLIPQQMAVLATPGALKQAETIRKTAEKQRAQQTAVCSPALHPVRGQLQSIHVLVPVNPFQQRRKRSIRHCATLSFLSGNKLDTKKESWPHAIRLWSSRNDSGWQPPANLGSGHYIFWISVA